MSSSYATSLAAAEVNAESASSQAYITWTMGLLMLGIASFIAWGLAAGDHFASIDKDGDRNWYQNYYDATRIEIQDRDILYHGIGRSIEHARQADIVVLGHSMVLFGLDYAQVEAFENKYGVKIFNMASAGDGSGEFVWRIIQRWNIRPKLWVINADDHAADFFSISIDAFGNSGKSNAGHVLSYDRMTARFNVLARDLRWRIEKTVATVLPSSVSSKLLVRSPHATWRSAVNGNIDYRDVSVFTSKTNPVITVVRDQNCHASESDIAAAKAYVDKIGGKSLLTLFPHTDQCPVRVAEMAQWLGLTTILPPDTNYTSFDHTHLDQRGADAFTRFFLGELEKTPDFKTLIEEKAGQTR